MTTSLCSREPPSQKVVEAYRLDRYDNSFLIPSPVNVIVVEAYRLDRYDNSLSLSTVVEGFSCRSLSFG